MLMNGRHMSAAYATPFTSSATAAAGAARTPSHALRPRDPQGRQAVFRAYERGPQFTGRLRTETEGGSAHVSGKVCTMNFTVDSSLPVRGWGGSEVHRGERAVVAEHLEDVHGVARPRARQQIAELCR